MGEKRDRIDEYLDDKTFLLKYSFVGELSKLLDYANDWYAVEDYISRFLPYRDSDEYKPEEYGIALLSALKHLEKRLENPNNRRKLERIKEVVKEEFDTSLYEPVVEALDSDSEDLEFDLFSGAKKIAPYAIAGILLATTAASGCISPTNPNHTNTTSSTTIEKDTIAPEIEDFNWTPTKVVWDKIYDIEVNFTVEDDKTPIKYAELHFIPVEYKYFITKYGMRPEDYPKVFPPDKERVYVLKPIDGEFDELKEEFSVDIKNITGGREYKIVAVVKDAAGNERTVEIKTPYIRQFENFAKQDNITVVASYMPWYEGGWEKDHNFKGYPLLGCYNVRDPIVIWKQADWATGYGIDAFLVNWGGDDKRSDENLHLMLKYLKSFRGAPKIGILWGPNPQSMKADGEQFDMDDPLNRNEFLREMEYLASEYMKEPLYFKLNGRPVIYMYNSNALKGNLSSLLEEARLRIVKITGGNPFLIGEEIGWLFTYPDDWFRIEGNSIERLKAFDGIGDWAGSHDRSSLSYIQHYERYLEKLYDKWSPFLASLKLEFIPSVIPGFDEIYVYYEPDLPPIPKTPQFFERRLRIALKHLSPNIRMLRIDTWNDWGEWSNIEPTSEEGFEYLQTLKQNIQTYKMNENEG